MTLKKINELLKDITSWIKRPVIDWDCDSSGQRYYAVKNSSSGKTMWLGFSQANHGIYSNPMGKWMIYSNGTQTYIDGKDPFNSSNQSTGTLPAKRLPVIFKTVSNTCAKFTLNAGSGGYKNIELSIPSGYELVAAIGVTSSHNQAVNVGGLYRANNHSITVTYRNNTSTNLTDMTYTVHGLCVLEDTW